MSDDITVGKSTLAAKKLMTHSWHKKVRKQTDAEAGGITSSVSVGSLLTWTDVTACSQLTSTGWTSVRVSAVIRLCDIVAEPDWVMSTTELHSDTPVMAPCRSTTAYTGYAQTHTQTYRATTATYRHRHRATTATHRHRHTDIQSYHIRGIA